MKLTSTLSNHKLSKTRDKKVRYILLISDDGIIYGAFSPDKEHEAIKYLNKQKKKLKLKIFKVSNLNQFLVKYKYDYRRKRAKESANSKHKQ